MCSLFVLQPNLALQKKLSSLSVPDEVQLWVPEDETNQDPSIYCLNCLMPPDHYHVTKML